MTARCVGIVLLSFAPRLEAQRPPAHAVRWWEAAIVVGAVGVLSVADRGVNDWMQVHRSSRSDAWARAFRNGGQPEVALGVPGAIIVAGIASGRPTLRRSGVRVLSSVVLAGVATGALKELTGRIRPAETSDPYLFRPFSNHDAFPSGHATMAFALATSLSEEIKNPWVAGLLYAGATGTAWSRLNDHRHWLSDVAAGATVGITAAKVIEGRWRIFGLGAPRFLADPHTGGARIEWSASF